jgi:acetylornithine deacetylase/succinyl-diaminopimelate desuccinylase-like protein
VNWSSTQDEVTHYLRELLRIDTTNPPGNEIRAVEFLAGVLKRDGIEPMVFESAPGRGNLVARLKGDGRAAPLLLMAHLDVVPAEADKWSHPPFSGDLADGQIWGRGALDTKDLAAMQLMVMLLLKRDGVPLSRDVIWMANADEEAGGNLGAGWMVKEHPDLIRAEYALNEGAGFTMDVLGCRFFTVQVGEKGSARFAMRAHGNPGHGSMPHRNNAVLKLADAVTRVGLAEMPHRVTPVAESFVQGLAAKVDVRHRADVLALLDSKKFSAALARLGSDGNGPMFYAMFHDTIAPTMLSAGTKINVIPSVAEARCDARILPGQTPENFSQSLRELAGPEIEIELVSSAIGFSSDYHTPLFDKIGHVLGRHNPDAPALPYLVVGATDARHVRKLGTKVYGFCPMIAAAQDLDGVHAHNEHISTDNLSFGTRVLHEVVSEFCGGGKQ